MRPVSIARVFQVLTLTVALLSGPLPGEAFSQSASDDPSNPPGRVDDITLGKVPPQYSLLQNYPNPFNPTTTIRYGLPKGSRVQLAVFNALGQRVSTLVDADQGPGYHDVRFDGTGLSAGIYFYRLEAGGSVRTRSLHLVK